MLIAAFLFPNLFGLIAQVSSETGGNFALYDIPTEVAMIALQLLFLTFISMRGTRFGFSSILFFVIPLYATGFAMFPNNWSSDNPFAGCLIRAGYVLLTVMLWALMARTSFNDPRHTYLYFGIYCSISDAQIGRLLGTVLMGDNGPSQALCQNISLGALWAICVFGLVMFFLLRREPVAPEAERTHTQAGNEHNPATQVIVPSASTFTMQFEMLSSSIGLTAREREVVVEALHGYSRANIAKKLALSPETVKTYLNRAYAKAQVTSKQELIELIEQVQA